MSRQFEDIIIGTRRLQGSRFGNPRYLVTFKDSAARKTEVDGQVGYMIDNRDVHGVPVIVTVNERGFITHVKPV